MTSFQLSTDAWTPAHLIPTMGIKGQQEQERRAASALLAVFMAVPEFAKAVLRQAGAPSGKITTFVEICLKDADGRTHIPDGAIIVERGKMTWRALVEIKTGTGALETDQVSRYMGLAKQHGFDAVVTLSNHITESPDSLPFKVDKRKLKSMPVKHLSWWGIMTEAILQHRYRGVSDPDQAWILGELITYLDHPNSGASGFDDMGPAWTNVREGAKHETLRSSDPEAVEVAERWDQFVDYVALSMSQGLGRDVTPVRTRGGDYHERVHATTKMLGTEGRLHAGLKVPDAVAPLLIDANLRTRRVSVSVEVAAPKEGRAMTRIMWMLRQIKTTPSELRIEVKYAGTKETTSCLVSDALENPSLLLSPHDNKREPRSFVLALGRKMGSKRGKTPGSFVFETKKEMQEFYESVVQNIKPWAAKAPQLQRLPRPEPDDPSPSVPVSGPNE